MKRGMKNNEVARAFGVKLSSVKCYVRPAEEGKPLTSKKTPGSLPKRTTSLLEGSARSWAEYDAYLRARLWKGRGRA